jgi:cytochrome c-type biogenesis protein CcmF
MAYMAAVWLAVVAAVYSVVANAAYIFTGVRTIAKAGGAIAHLGFALMLLGILISSSKKEILSYYTGGIPAYFGKDSKENPGENVTLVKGLKTDMGKYWVTYERDSTHPLKPLWYYHLNFESKDGKDNFYLSPNAFVNYKGNMGLMANPDARHYLTYDVFTYITSLPDPDKRKDTAQFRPVELSVGDTLFYSKGFGILEGLQTIKNIPGIEFGEEDSATVATISI